MSPYPAPAVRARRAHAISLIGQAEVTILVEMIAIPGGRFWMGSNDHYPEEAPAREVNVDPFRMDRTPVTNAMFKAFVVATGYVTCAESAPNPKFYPSADPALLKPGSALFVRPERGATARDPFDWWRFEVSVNWRRPWGEGSSDELPDHPVVHIAYPDAQAFADWAGKRLPTEAEWEFAARGGLDRQPYAWGAELSPQGRLLANYWQGTFPQENLCLDGFERTSPVGAFPANGYGLVDMIGNVWEWTSDWYAQGSRLSSGNACCVPRNPRGGTEVESRDLGDPGAAFGRKVLKGGSHLCAANYCQRYRPAARYPQTIDTSTSHIGFRCVEDALSSEVTAG